MMNLLPRCHLRTQVDIGSHLEKKGQPEKTYYYLRFLFCFQVNDKIKLKRIFKKYPHFLYCTKRVLLVGRGFSSAKVKIKSFYSGYIPTLKACLKSQELAERRQKCLDYLSKDSNSSLIKNELTIPFTKTQDNEAKDLKVELEKKGYAPILSESVNANSLNAHIRSVKEKGLPFEDDLFKVFFKTETKIEKGNNNE